MKAGKNPKKPQSPPPKAAARPASVHDLLDRDEDALRKQLKEAASSVRAVRAMLPRLTALSGEERQSSIGRVTLGELPELRELLDVVDDQPAVFASLAPRDRGTDLAVVESWPTRKALDVLEQLLPLEREVTELRTALSDMRLRLGTEVRMVTTAVRAIAQANAPHNEFVRAGLARVEAHRKERVAKGGRSKRSAKKAETPPKE